MSLSIEAARERIGLPAADTSRDKVLHSVMSASIILVEAYLDRKITLGVEQEMFRHPGRSVVLRRWPVEEVRAVTDADGVAVHGPVVLDAVNGVLSMRHSHQRFPEVTVVAYCGGWPACDFPADLGEALWATFDAVWAATPGAGAAAGSGGLVQGTGEMKSFSIPGVFSATYDVGATAVGGGSGDKVSGLPWGLVPGVATALLERYMNHALVGVG